MAKFCGHCGTKLDDSAKICGNCGRPLGDAAGKIPGVDYASSQEKAQKKQKSKKTVKLVLVIAALVLVAAAVISLVGNFTGYNGLTRKVMSAYKSYNIEKLVDLSSGVYDYSAEEYARVYFENMVGYALDSFENELGHDYKISYEIVDTYKMNKRSRETLEDELTMIYPDYDDHLVDSVAVAVVEVTAKRGGNTAYRSLEIIMTKEGGSWKLLYING